jgi:hypothetical protein
VSQSVGRFARAPVAPVSFAFACMSLRALMAALVGGVRACLPLLFASLLPPTLNTNRGQPRKPRVCVRAWLSAVHCCHELGQ